MFASNFKLRNARWLTGNYIAQVRARTLNTRQTFIFIPALLIVSLILIAVLFILNHSDLFSCFTASESVALLLIYYVINPAWESLDMAYKVSALE